MVLGVPIPIFQETPAMIRPTRLLAAALASAALVVGLSGAPAGATLSGVGVTDVTPTDGDTVTVSGTASAGATISIAVCNTDVPVVGTDCNRSATDRYARVTANGSGGFSVPIVVDHQFPSASFIPGTPASTTDTFCDSTGGSDQCAVVVVEYVANGPGAPVASQPVREASPRSQSEKPVREAARIPVPHPIAAARRATTVLVVALLAGGSLLLAPPAAAQETAPTPIAEGSLTWGFKASFRAYLASGPTPPVVDLTGGATTDAAGVLTFPVEDGSFDPATGTTEVDLAGSVRWRKYEMEGSSPPPGYPGPLDGHILDMTLAEPHLTIAAGVQELTFEVTARDQATWAMVPYGRIAMANLSIADVEPEVTDTTTTWTGVPSTITAVGADEVMFGQYRPGVALDPVTVTYTGPGGAPDLSETWDEPGSTRLGDPTIAALGAGTSGSAWLVDEPHQVVHHPTSATVEGGTQRGLQAFDLATLAPVGTPHLFPVGASVPNIALYRTDTGRAYYEAPDGSMAWIEWDPAGRAYRTGTATIPFPSTKRAMWDPVGQRAFSIERRVPAGVDTRAYDQHQWLLHVLTETTADTWSVVSHPLPSGPTGLNQSWYRSGVGGVQRSWAVAGDGSLVLTRSVNAQAPATLPATLPLQRLVVGAEGVTVGTVPGSDAGSSGAERWGAVRSGPDGLFVATRPHSGATGAPSLVQAFRVDDGAVAPEGGAVSAAPTQVNEEWSFDPVDGTLWGASSTTRELVAVRDGRVVGRRHHPALHARNPLVVVGADQDVYAQTMVGEDQFSFQLARFPRLGSSPAVTTQPVDRTVTLGLGEAAEDVTFTASGTGTPDPTVRWQAASPGASRFADVAGGTGPTLTVAATAGHDGTRYRAVVENPAGATVTDEVLLTVRAAPTVTAQPQDVAAVEGDDATFGLAVTGNPQPAIQWQRSSGGFWVDLPEASDPFVTVEDTNLDMDGTRIRARLRNDVATTYTRTATLTVAERPDGPVTVVGGDLDWGVRESFRRYITGSIAHGEIAVSEGATVDTDDTFRFPAADGTVVDDTIDAAFDGRVRFTGHDGTGTPPGVPALDLTIDEVRVEVEGDTGTLVADVASRGLDDGAVATYDDVAFATLDLAAVAPTPVADGLRWTGIPATLTEDGSAAFADFYAAGEALDPLDVTLELGDAEPPRTEAESYVTAALTDVLGAPPDDAAVAAGVAALAASPSRSAYLATLVRSDAWLEAIVDRLYLDTLGRPADPAGAAFWVERLRSGSWSVARVAASFHSSDEYLARAGGTVAAWVEDLYDTLLGRPADADGRAYWVAEAGRIGRGAVALRQYQSPESARSRVADLYDRLLGRAPSAGDADWWAPVVVRRGDLALAVALAASDEYVTRARLRFP
jgi:hypothetical protein